MIFLLSFNKLGYSTYVEIPFYRKSRQKKIWRVLHPKKSLFDCISPIMATNRPRKKKCHAVKSAICLWQMCITGGVIFFIVRSYTNAETENYQFNCRKYTDSCYYQRQLITQSLRKPYLCTWNAFPEKLYKLIRQKKVARKFWRSWQSKTS